MSFRCFLQKEYILLFHYIIPNRNCNKYNPKKRYNLYFKNYIFILIRIEYEKALSSDRT